MQKTPQQSHIDENRGNAGNTITDKLSGDHSVHMVRPRVKVILPLHNEAENIKAVCAELLSELSSNGYSPDILLVDDGSTDASLSVATSLAASNTEISFISFSRNFGKETALMAGINECGEEFEYLAYMDSDGQHDPKDLLKMLATAGATGSDLICGARVDRDYQTGPQRWLVKRFYKLFHALTDQRIHEGVGDFNVLSPRVVHALRRMTESHPFMKGIISWVGFRPTIVPICIRPRAGGVAKSSTRKMLRLAAAAFLSFSSWPLRIWSAIGMTSALLATSYLLIVVADTVINGADVPGYATTVVLLLGLGGLQLMSIGILGEYVARIYDASKDRPRYLIQSRG